MKKGKPLEKNDRGLSPSRRQSEGDRRGRFLEREIIDRRASLMFQKRDSYPLAGLGQPTPVMRELPYSAAECCLKTYQVVTDSSSTYSSIVTPEAELSS